MKKIVGAALVLTMMTGAAFAADLSFSYTASNYFNTKGGNFEYMNDARADCLSVGLSGDVAGVVVDFDIDSGKLVQDEYYGWMNFALPVGSLQITAGSWNSRYVDRINDDKGDSDGEDWEYFKPGVINWLTVKGYEPSIGGMDSDNLTEGKLGTILAYTLEDSLPGTLLVKGGIVSNTWDSDDDTTIASGFVGEVAYRQDDLINANVAIKSFDKDNLSVGLFVSPLMIENLKALFGFTFANVKSGNYGDGNEFGIDLRLRYQVNENFAITTMHNISQWYYFNDSYGTEDNFTGMWNQLGFSYKVTDNLTAKAAAQMYISDLNRDGAESKDGYFIDQIYLSPALEIKATERATVTTTARFGWDKVGTHNTENFSLVIPVIFSYSL